jgi:hypothetical protein
MFGFKRSSHPAGEAPGETREPVLPPEPPGDLGTQLEDLLVTIWEAECWWRAEDRIDMAVRAGHGGGASPDGGRMSPAAPRHAAAPRPW